LLDGGAVFGEWDLEGGAVPPAGAWMGRGFARGVVVVAEVFSAETWTAATMAVGEDVAALVLFGGFGGVLHGVSPTGTFLCKVFEREEMSPDFRFMSSVTLCVKCEGPAFWPGLEWCAAGNIPSAAKAALQMQ
jgi:hypothetical protein